MSDTTVVSRKQGKGEEQRKKTTALKNLVSAHYRPKSAGNGVLFATLLIMSLSTYRTFDSLLTEISGAYVSRPFSVEDWTNVKLFLRVLVVIGDAGIEVRGFKATSMITLEIARAAEAAGKDADACRLVAIRAYRLNRILAQRCRNVDREQIEFKETLKRFEKDLKEVLNLFNDIAVNARGKLFRKGPAFTEHKLLQANTILDRCVELFTADMHSHHDHDNMAVVNDKLENIRYSLETMVGSPHHKFFRISRAAPSLPDELIGRSDSLSKALSLITSTSGAKVAILGEKGVGKTALALSILQHEEIVTSFGNYRYFVPCENLTEPTQLITGILQLMGKDTTDQQTVMHPLAKLQHYLSVTGNILLILDHFESLTELTGKNAQSDLARTMEVLSMPSVTVVLTMGGQYAPNILNWNARLRLEPFDDALALLKQAADDVALRNKLLLDFEMSNEKAQHVVTPKSSGHVQETTL